MEEEPMNKKLIKRIKPIKSEHKSLPHKGTRISYSVLDYGKCCSGFAYITFFTKDGFHQRCIYLQEPLESMKEAKTEIIGLAKNWIKKNFKNIA